MKHKHIWTGTIFCALSLLSAIFTFPIEAGEETVNIVDTIFTKSEGRITIKQSESLAHMMERDTIVEKPHSNRYADDTEENKAATRVVHKAGYRIQIYSDNNQRRAKSTAEKIALQIRERFPSIGAYIAYKAPYWRLKAGDFITRQEAVHMMAEMKKAFPAYAGEMIIVRDRINIIE